MTHDSETAISASSPTPAGRRQSRDIEGSHGDGGQSQAGSRRPSTMVASRRPTISQASRKSISMSRGSLWPASASGILGAGLGYGGGRHKNVQFENTYRLEAKPEEMFSQKQVEDLLHEVLVGSLSDAVYEAKVAQTLTKNLANVIRKRVRETTNMTRFKFVVLVHIGSPKNSSISIGSRAVWFPEAGDNFAEATYTNGAIFCVASVFATYYD